MLAHPDVHYRANTCSALVQVLYGVRQNVREKRVRPELIAHSICLFAHAPGVAENDVKITPLRAQKFTMYLDIHNWRLKIHIVMFIIEVLACVTQFKHDIPCPGGVLRVNKNVYIRHGAHIRLRVQPLYYTALERQKTHSACRQRRAYRFKLGLLGDVLYKSLVAYLPPRRRSLPDWRRFQRFRGVVRHSCDAVLLRKREHPGKAAFLRKLRSLLSVQCGSQQFYQILIISHVPLLPRQSV